MFDGSGRLLFDSVSLGIYRVGSGLVRTDSCCKNSFRVDFCLKNPIRARFGLVHFRALFSVEAGF